MSGNEKRAEHDPLGNQDAAPTSDELLVMAYVDDELDRAARAELESRLVREPALARTLAEQRRVAVAARECAPPEPLESEWRRRESSLAQRGSRGVAWLAIVAGLVLVGGAGAYAVWTSSWSLAARVGVLALGGGALVFFALTLHNRLATRHLDPYVDVKR
jgi:anti-sigma factor RsiW